MEFSELDKSLIRLYGNGHSIDFIARSYYRRANHGLKNVYTDNGFYIAKKNVNLAEAKNYVTTLIYRYILQKNQISASEILE